MPYRPDQPLIPQTAGVRPEDIALANAELQSGDEVRRQNMLKFLAALQPNNQLTDAIERRMAASGQGVVAPEASPVQSLAAPAADYAQSVSGQQALGSLLQPVPLTENSSLTAGLMQTRPNTGPANMMTPMQPQAPDQGSDHILNYIMRSLMGRGQ